MEGEGQGGTGWKVKDRVGEDGRERAAHGPEE